MTKEHLNPDEIEAHPDIDLIVEAIEGGGDRVDWVCPFSATGEHLKLAHIEPEIPDSQQ